MYEIGDKRTKRICKWIASVLTVALIFNESGIPALAAEIQEAEGFTIEAEAAANEEQPQEQPTQAETQEQQEGDAPETVVPEPEPVAPEPEAPVNQESGVENENMAPAENASQAELNNESYVSEPGVENEPGTEIIAVEESETQSEAESESESEECSEVSVSETEVTAAGEMAVSTQEELAVALLTGVSKITLAADISLTMTMIVPANVDIVLDGQGFSLKRGTDENGAFIGTMIYLNGSENAEGTSGSLTLTNICVDGQIVGTANRAGSSAIIDLGNLILDEGAVVKGNCNYGTYDGVTPVINDYGGGVQVYGELTVTERALVTGNFADEFGGGVYLAESATLYLHADVIRENAVAEGTGYGADLYAATGSTIYYNTAIDMTRDGFCLCEGVNLVGLDMPAAYADRKDENVEIFINVSEMSGYTKAQVEELTRKLEAKGYKVLENRTDIDTTDLRDWYVYDHYDPQAWTALGKTWEDEYGGNERRKYYSYAESASYYDKTGSYSNVNGSMVNNMSVITNPVYTISDWLKRQNDYNVVYLGISYPTLARYKEHIYTRNENGYPEMTFVGYGHPAFVDFLFYNPESDGEKVVNFDIDSSGVITHTLTGSGFLVNTGIENDKLYGYLVYYTYTENTTAATSIKIYYLNGISASALHEGNYDLKLNKDILGTPISEYAIPSDKWNNQMSIQIKATPTSIEVKQQPKESVLDINQTSPILTCNLSKSTYSGFGPLVAYTSDGHTCWKASSFTYSNLRMYFTNPELEPADMLNPLEKADFSQQNTQKYFLNLFGNSTSYYNESAHFGQYQEYLKMMQGEGIALITDKKTPFTEYLGDNLCEINKDNEGILSIDEIVNQISTYIGSKTTTYMEDKLEQTEGDGGIPKAEPKQSVGNIWLKSVSSGKQIRALNGDSLPNSGFTIQPMDDISNYYGNGENFSVKYEIIKPNGSVVLLPSTGSGNNTPPSFIITKDRKEWPAGRYAVKQTINDSSVHGYAYFELSRKDIEVTINHAVTLNVRKDDIEWTNHGKIFALSENHSEPFYTNYLQLPDGTYQIYEIIQNADGTSVYADTNAAVTVNGADITATVDYYTITFHDGETILDAYGKTVPKGTKVTAVSDPPEKDGYAFHGWYTSEDGSTEFAFDAPIITKTDIYAKWLATVHAVTINVQKDDTPWADSGKRFALSLDEGETFIEDYMRVSDGVYKIYETVKTAQDVQAAGIGEALQTSAYTDTGVTVTVNGADANAAVDYYTVTFYNGDEVYERQIVLKNKEASAPSVSPTKEGYNFYHWGASAAAEDDTEFNLGTPITAKTNLYAKWLAIPEVTYKISVTAGAGGSVSPSGEVIVKEGADQQFIITPDDGYQIDAVLADNNAVTLENAVFSYRTLSGSVRTETVEAQRDAAEINPLNNDKNTTDNKKQYIFKNVTANHTLSVTFKAIPKKKSTKKTSSDGGPVETDTRVISAPAPAPVPVVLQPEMPEPVPATKDSEPKTGDTSHVEVYATIGMIAGLSYLILYFSDGESGMTEEEKKEIVGALVKWARKGKRFRKYVALAIVFVILVYYHSIGKRTTTEWKELCE